jgi:hypothetical protein
VIEKRKGTGKPGTREDLLKGGGSSLKREVRTQLQGPAILGASSSDCAVTTAGTGQHAGGGANREVLVGQPQARVVEGIVGIGTDFYVNAFREVERFTQAKVDLFQARAGELITTRVSEGAGGRYRKRGLVEPLILVTIRQLGVADYIREPLEVVTSQ